MAGVGISLLLGIQTTEQLNQFLHNSIDNFVGKIGSTLNNINGDIDWSSDDYESARKFVQNIYRNIASNPDYNIDEELSELGTEKLQCVQNCYDIRKPEIQRAVTTECLARMDLSYVTDFDWKLKWIIGSSTLSSIREPVVQMDFHTTKIDQDDNKANKTVNIEMNTPELDIFINEIEKCLAEFKN